MKDFVTGGGFITLPSGAKGTFGMVGGQKPNGLQGHFTYQDHEHRPEGDGDRGDGLRERRDRDRAARSRTPATVNGTPASILVTVSDNGEPGGGVDGFKVSSAPYSATGPTITKGNIQLHQPGGCTTSTKPPKGKP